MNKLIVIHTFLTECGIDAEIRHDRKQPYINVGNVNLKKERMQFWVQEKSAEVKVYVGTDMGIWYSASRKSPYLNLNWYYISLENQLVFPSIYSMKEFVKNVAAQLP